MTSHDDDDDQPFEDFETKDEVRDRAGDQVVDLEKSRTKAHRELARKLDACRTDDPCGSGACPRCMRMYRLRWIGEVCALVENDWSRP